MLRKTLFVLRLAGNDLKGNAAVHAVAGAIISCAFLTLGLFVLVAVNLRSLGVHWEEKIQVCVYLDDQVGGRPVEILEEKLRELDGVSKVEYVSEDDALFDFKRMLGEDAGLLDGVEDNPLPASFVVHLTPEARDVDRVKEISAAVSGLPGVAEVDYGGEWLESFSAAVNVVEGVVVLIGVLILVAVVFIISNTVRLTMYSRSDEIGIMRLVGASNSLIRMPFLIEGMVQGGAAATLGVAALWVIFQAGLKGMAWPGVFSGFSPAFLPLIFVISIIASGAILGAAGSLSRVTSLMRV